MAKFKLHYDKAVEVSKIAVGMLERKVFPFDKTDVLPDAILPPDIEPKSQEHALFLFYGCSLDSMRRAEDVYNFMGVLAQRIDLRDLYAQSLESLKRLLKPFVDKTSNLGKPAKTLHNNSMRLFKEYGNDPRNLKRDTIDATLDEMTGKEKGKRRFTQIGLGKASLLMKNYVRFGIWDFSEYEIPIKIDRHVMRISMATGILEAEEELRTDKVVRPLSNFFRTVTTEEQISAIKLDDAMWGIGSKLCLPNDQIYCGEYCELSCKTRPKARKKTAYFHPGKEMRKNVGQQTLFPVFR